MSVFPRGKTWWYKFRWSLKVDGKRESYPVRRSAKTHSRREAERREAEHKTALGRGEVHPLDPFPKVEPAAPKPMSLVAYSEVVLRHVALHRKESTVNFYRECLARIGPFKALADAPIHTITADLIDSYIDWRRSATRGNSIHAINGELRTLRRILYYAEEKSQIVKAPTVHELPGAEPRQHVVTPAEETEYLKAASPRLRSLAIVAADTGMRDESELFPLRWEHVGEDSVQVIEGKTPNAPRTIPLTPRAKAVFSALRTERQKNEKGQVVRMQSPWVFPSRRQSGTGHLVTIQKVHERSVKKAGLKPFAFMSWRHTFGTRCAEAGMDEYAIAKLMGHSSPAVARKYYIKVSSRHVNENFARLVEYQTKQSIEAFSSVSKDTSLSPEMASGGKN
jgi:integrase